MPRVGRGWRQGLSQSSPATRSALLAMVTGVLTLVALPTAVNVGTGGMPPAPLRRYEGYAWPVALVLLVVTLAVLWRERVSRADRDADELSSTGLHVGLIHEPSIPDDVAAWLGGIGQQRCEPLHPPVDGDMVSFDAAHGEQLLNVAVGQAEAQVPADRQHDDVEGEAEAGEGGAGDGAGRERRVLMPTVSLLEGGHRERNSAQPGVAQGESTMKLG